MVLQKNPKHPRAKLGPASAALMAAAVGSGRQDRLGCARSRAEGTAPRARRRDRRPARHRAHSVIVRCLCGSSVLSCLHRWPCGSASISAAPRSKGSRSPMTGASSRAIGSPRPRGNYDDTIRAVVDLVIGSERVRLRRTDSAARRTRRSHGRRRHSRRDLSRHRLIKNANSTWLIGRPLASDLARALDRPVRLANDANCFALSEATDGAAAGAAVVFGVIIGTGTGGGLVVNGRVVTGANAIAGEWGHNPLPAPEDDERPGPHVTAADRVHRNVPVGSGAGARLCRARRRRRAGDRGRVSCRRGERRAIACLDRYERRFARAIASVINVVDPDVIVLGGGLSNTPAPVRSRSRAVGGARVLRSRGYQTAACQARRRERRARRGVALG